MRGFADNSPLRTAVLSTQRAQASTQNSISSRLPKPMMMLLCGGVLDMLLVTPAKLFFLPGVALAKDFVDRGAENS